MNIILAVAEQVQNDQPLPGDHFPHLVKGNPRAAPAGKQGRFVLAQMIGLFFPKVIYDGLPPGQPVIKNEPLKTTLHGKVILTIDKLLVEAAQVKILPPGRVPGERRLVGEFAKLAAQFLTGPPPPDLIKGRHFPGAATSFISLAAAAITFFSGSGHVKHLPYTLCQSPF